jgi:hypothetical protein
MKAWLARAGMPGLSEDDVAMLLLASEEFESHLRAIPALVADSRTLEEPWRMQLVRRPEVSSPFFFFSKGWKLSCHCWGCSCRNCVSLTIALCLEMHGAICAARTLLAWNATTPFFGLVRKRMESYQLDQLEGMVKELEVIYRTRTFTSNVMGSAHALRGFAERLLTSEDLAEAGEQIRAAFKSQQGDIQCPSCLEWKGASSD